MEKFRRGGMMNNEAMWKAMGKHFTKDAASHRNHAACHAGLSACLKSLGVDFTKGDKNDFHQELANQHEADADRCDKMAEMCTKCATKADEAELVKAITGSIVEYMDKKYGNMIVPDGGVRKVFQTADPNAVS